MNELWGIVLMFIAAVGFGLLLVHLDDWNDLD